MLAAFPIRTLAVVLALSLAGCASMKSKPSGPEPMETPIDMNLAQSGQTAENPFAKAFISRNLQEAALQHEAGGPKVYRGEDQVDDNQRMLENGYDMLGYSEFIAGPDLSPDLVLQQAKSIHADMALIYARLAGEVPLSIKLQQLRDQAKNADGSTSAAPAQTSYTYFTSYWARLAPPVLGVHVMSPAEDVASSGVEIIAVIKDSPAAKAGLRDGDILTRIGDMPLKNPLNLTEAARKYAGQKVNVTLMREGRSDQVQVALNKRR